MKKLFRRIAASAAVLAALLAAVCLFGCGSPETATYTVTVTGADSSVIEAVQVQLKQGGKVKAKKSPVNGIAEFELPAGTYTVTLDGAEGYEWTEQTVTAENPTAALELTEKTASVTYAVTVQLPDGTPVAGIVVQLCTADTSAEGAVCVTQPTDQNGVATFTLQPDEYVVHIEQGQDAYPENCTFDNSKYRVSAEGGSFTVLFEEN